MLNLALMRLRPCLLAAASLLGAMHWAKQGQAQTVTASGAMFPERFVNGQDLGVSTRPQNLNPLGISFADCNSNMVLRFSVTLSGFTGAQNMQIWASKSSDCTATIDRGLSTGGAVCWFLGQQIVGQPNLAPHTVQFDIRVQDIVGPQNSTTPQPTFTSQGPSACFAQPTFSPIPINIDFVPLDSGNVNSVGTAFQYVLNTDMVGPPAPAGVSESVGDTLMNVTWTANTDSDTTGYDIFIDPIPGQEGAEASVVLPEPILVCPDTGAAPIADAGDDSGTASDAATTSTTDAACHFENVSGTGESVDGATVCNDPILAMSVVQDAGGVVVTTAGDDGGEAGAIESGVGGISTIPTANLVNAGNGTGITVADKSAGQFTITGLKNLTTYNVVVAAVDSYGNVGPSSTEVCDFPAPTQDFWKTYVTDGGGAGGGFCALDAAGAPVPSLAGAAFLVSAVALARRRRRGVR
jgi:hypothetical protein